MADNNVGTKRLVVGARYGMKDWLAQRVTAIVMAVYTIIVLISFLSGSKFNYDGWAGMFAQQWFKLATFVTFVALFYHAWVGMREIFMDYVKPAGWRLGLEVITIVCLTGCAGWAAQIIWSV